MVRVKRGYGLVVAAGLVLSGLVVVGSGSQASAASVTFTVNSLADGTDANPGNGTCATAAAVCTLRAAITEANATPANTPTINFSVAGTIDISAGGNLPTLNVAGTVIDASAAPGHAVATGPTVTIKGNSATTNALSGLTLNAANTTIRALRFGKLGKAIDITQSAAHARIMGNWIGNDGSAFDPELGVGAAVNSAADDTKIGSPSAADRNLIGGFRAKGIRLTATATSSTIEGNYVGTNAAGTASVADPDGTGLFTIVTAQPTPNGAIDSNAAGTVIRGNLVAGNPGWGITIFGSAATATIVGNKIGTDVTGVAWLPNVGKSIELQQQATATIGGTGAADGNVIAGPNGFVNKGSSYATPIQAIDVDGSAATILGNRIGVGSGGAAFQVGTSAIGVDIKQTTTSGSPVAVSTVALGGSAAGAGNVISGLSTAVYVRGASSALLDVSIKGNRIGTDPTGTTVVGNSAGITIGANSKVVVGGAAAGEGNLLSGNRSPLEASDNGSGLVIKGNLIGTNAAGTTGLSTTSSEQGTGIKLSASTLPDRGTVAQVGGPEAGAGNVIARVQIGLQLGSKAVVQGNKIGTNTTGTASLGVGYQGIYLQSPSTIGGSATGAGNLISGVAGYGILGDAGATGAVIQGNTLGTNLAGTAAIPNNIGVSVSGATDVTIGGSAPGEGNRIANNAYDGVLVGSGTGKAVNTKVRGNRIYANGGLAIDLDQHDPDGAGNNDQLPPTLTSATAAPGGTSVSGSVTSTVAGTVAVDVFTDVTCSTAWGAGELRQYLGTITFAHPGGGADTAFSGSVSGAPSGSLVTATATTPTNGTSQVSVCAPVSDLAGTVTPNFTTISVGGDLAHLVRVKNRGPVAATNVIVKVVAASTASDAATADAPSQGTVDLDAATWNIGTLAPGAVATVCVREDIVRDTTTLTTGGSTFEVPAWGSVQIDTKGAAKDPFFGNDRTDDIVAIDSPAVGGAGAALCPLPALTIDDASATRPSTGAAPITFTVHLPSAQTRPVTVHYQTQNGTAVAVEDYVATSGDLTIPAGQATGTITVPAVASQSDEPDKSFTLQLSAPKHAVVGDASAIGTVKANHVLGGCPTGSTSNQRFVCHVYFDALGRTPDSGGFNYWVGKLNKGTPRSTMASSYLGQPESLRKVADRAYVLYLGRHGTNTELTNWATKLKAKSVSTQDIRISVLASSEYYAHTGGTNASYVQQMFRDVFRRNVDSSGLAYWTGQLSSGKTRTNVATRFLAEPEGRRKIIGDIYLRFLRRDPTANEANGWVSQLAANKTEVDVGIALVSSTEYFNRPSS